jgi:hypothetical protein
MGQVPKPCVLYPGAQPVASFLCGINVERWLPRPSATPLAPSASWRKIRLGAAAGRGSDRNQHHYAENWPRRVPALALIKDLVPCPRVRPLPHSEEMGQDGCACQASPAIQPASGHRHFLRQHSRRVPVGNTSGLPWLPDLRGERLSAEPRCLALYQGLRTLQRTTSGFWGWGIKRGPAARGPLIML